jgi:hypothetical protein
MSVRFLRVKLFATLIISLLICALFLSYCSIDYAIGASRDTFAKSESNANKLKFSTNKLTDSEQEEILSDYTLANSHYASFEKKWMLYYLYIFSILIISVFAFYIKGWFIKVTHSRFQFHQVHFIQLKDGKKSALSYR